MTSVSRSDIVVFVRDNNNYYRQGQRMTRKDYELIARVVKRERDSWNENNANPIAIDTCHRFGEGLAYELENDNPRFDRAKFLKACGL